MKAIKIEEDIQNFSVLSKAVTELSKFKQIKINFLEGKVLLGNGETYEYIYRSSARRFRKQFTYLLAKNLLFELSKQREGSIEQVGVDGYVINTGDGKFFFGLTHKFRGLMEYNEYAVRRFEDGIQTENGKA
ncbi:MAG: hypothetical protein QW051_00645 [Candidatus Aenigmatarchaeota archaeon]